MRRSCGLLTILLALAPAWPAAGQVPDATGEPLAVALLEGQVVDSVSGDPLAGVLVRVDTGQETLTDRTGRFRFADLAEGRRLIAFLTEDCRVTWAETTVLRRFPREVRYRVPQAFGASSAQEARETEDRQRTTGRRLLAEEIDRMNASSIMEVIRRVAPGMVSPMQGAPGDDPSIVASRGRSLGAEDPPVVVIDGVRTPAGARHLTTMRPSEVAELEIQPGAAAGWEYGSSGASGVIKITLRRGIPDGALERAAVTRCVVPGFSGR